MIKDKLTEKIIGCAYKVHKDLGSGFLEKVYENAMMIELRDQGLQAEQQINIPVYYKDKLVGDYYADIIVEGEVILELKAIDNLIKIHEVQLVNYLQGTGTEIGLLINFGSSVTIKRKYREYNKQD